MVLSLSKSELLRYVQAQTRTFFPDGYDLRGGDVEIAFRTALERTECCIDAISVGNYHNAVHSHISMRINTRHFYIFWQIPFGLNLKTNLCVTSCYSSTACWPPFSFLTSAICLITFYCCTPWVRCWETLNTAIS